MPSAAILRIAPNEAELAFQASTLPSTTNCSRLSAAITFNESHSLSARSQSAARSMSCILAGLSLPFNAFPYICSSTASSSACSASVATRSSGAMYSRPKSAARRFFSLSVCAADPRAVDRDMMLPAEGVARLDVAAACSSSAAATSSSAANDVSGSGSTASSTTLFFALEVFLPCGQGK